MDISDDDWHRGMEVYLMNAIRPTRLVTPVMQKAGGGSIINISTFAAFEPDPLFPTSGVFRAGLAAFTKLFSDKYAADNIRMNNVLPGFIDSLPETEDRRARIPMGRYGRAEEVSAMISYLASDAAAYVTGQNFRIDGGLTASVWTPDRERAESFARELETGTVFQNRCDYLDPGLPWTGVKDSGKGSTLSRYGFFHLTRRKAIHLKD